MNIPTDDDIRAYFAAETQHVVRLRGGQALGLMHAMDLLAQLVKTDELLADAGGPSDQAMRDDVAIAHAVVCRLVSLSTARIGVFLSGPLTDAQADQLEEATRSMEAIGQRAEERLLDRCLAAARADRLGDS